LKKADAVKITKQFEILYAEYFREKTKVVVAKTNNMIRKLAYNSYDDNYIVMTRITKIEYI